jgi:poly-gamma-glutamate capsule biosynthesis protein CapA/YwtB (metallophosphatase superfamily)
VPDSEADRTLPPLPFETIAAVQRDVRVCAGGDVMLGSNLDTLWAGRLSARLGRPVVPLPNPDRLLSPLRPLVADADIVLLNVEGAIGDGPAPSKCRPGSTSCYAFRQPSVVSRALVRLVPDGVVIGNVANNHALDAGVVGYQATLRNLGLAGAYATGADTMATVVATSNGDTVAFLGFSTSQAGPDPRDLRAVRRHVARAATRHARVVVTMHMGAEGRDAQRTPDAIEYYLGEDRGNAVAFARTAVDAGASTVIGHGPHVMRAAEWYRGALILYSLGNLLTYGTFNLSEPMNRGAIACVSLDAAGRITAAVLRSTKQERPGVVAPDVSNRAAVLVDSLSRIDFPDTATGSFGEAVLIPPQSDDESAG